VAFRLLILYLVLTFLRLGELYPALAPYQIMNRGLLLCGAATAGAMAFGRVQYLRLPQPYLVVAFMLWCMSSAVLAQRWLGGYAAPFAVLSPNVALFLLLFLNLDSERRLRIGVAVLAVLGLIVALQALYSYHTLWRAQTFLLRTTEDDMDRDVSWDSPESAVSEAEVEADPQPPATEQGDDTEQAGDSRPASQVYIVRLRSLGFLHDPNDFAQALVSMVPLVLALRRPSRRLGNLLLVWLPIAGLLYAIALTRSRGAIIALATLCFLALRPWLGRAASLVIGTL
jgi:putative inorganic carbon (HCO3(-)) transporter